MKRFPLELNARIKKFVELSGPGSSPDEMKLKTIFISCDKICFYPDDREMSSTKTTKICEWHLKDKDMSWLSATIKNYLDDKWEKERLLFCFYQAFISPTMYEPESFSSSRGVLLKGMFFSPEEGFEIQPIIDRDKQIEEILK